ncbi:ribosome silencing factor [Labilibaculum sp. DW002]|jgi:ribosome-associated protein|uniref:Ribosomal silencing factor RsfS n=1 Tax=Paralabilibaculum antarcticum TaxID=2912572 RepID=A0ABT5VUM1_9BACT|nr:MULTISPECIES: ribosome silencing factor [unclassified Labilibaculum]MBI9056364.1 ribosome silencing factor [Labilibaculum sp.]MDE5418198.1 ribosome silencing factor [Labilibaculum sp. DW002]|eukprot:TRINITY_DN6847_c0_g2_i1.p1 TRINITY_DN6847_c0_g2~~TRINITY_DN6847_c0_g2_i1.p1  ORF type:complete len:124 (+),score=27.71 TRINITY_DN6847_c0_g2_i1:151-522(+)
MTKKKGNATEELVDAIIEGLKDKKAVDIVKIDLRNIDSSVCKYFIICHGTSTAHVSGITNSLPDFVREKVDEKLWKKEGHQNSQWILLDYADVVVHVFQKEYRDFYRLESLWADATVTKIKEA